MEKAAKRAVILGAIFLAAFGAVAYRLEQLQIADASQFKALAQSDYIRSVPIPAPRGQIVTSDGMVLATNKPYWQLEWMNPQSGSLPPQEAKRVAKLLGTTVSQLNSLVAQEERQNLPYWPAVLNPQTGLTPQQMTIYEENRSLYPDLHILAAVHRYYPEGSLLGNFVGFASQINQAQLTAHPHAGYRPTSLYGQMGLEQYYQSYLRGKPGQQLVEVNPSGNFVKVYGTQPAVPGNTLHLTINSHLEVVATQALQFVMHAMQVSPGAPHSSHANRGAVIVLDPETGAVLAIASLPSYNPNQLIPPVSKATINAMNVNHEWVNLAIQGQYSPGSIFKPIIGSSALGAGVITPSTTIFDPGYFPLDPQFHNWYRPGFGYVNIERALEVSDDTFFYYVGYWMGIQRMDHWLGIYGLNSTTGIDIPGEVPSMMPTPQRYQQINNYPWTWGQNLNTAIGQGISDYTLIGLARAEAAVANGGTLYQPHLMQSITAPNGKVIKVFKPVVQGRTGIPQYDYHVVHIGMERSAQKPLGTGYGAMAGIPMYVATKTGTAQKLTGSVNNAFFTTFAPANAWNSSGPLPKPQLEVLVYIHDGVFGSFSGFVARAIYDQYFHLKDPSAQTLFDSLYAENVKWPFSWTGKPYTPTPGSIP